MCNKIPKLVQKISLDMESAILVVSAVNRYYLSGFNSSDGIIFITRDESYFFVDFRYYEAAKHQIKELNVVLTADLKKDILKNALKHQIKTVFIENDGITLSEAIKVENWLKEGHIALNKQNTLDKAIYSLRAQKDALEVKNLKMAQKIAEDALNQLLPEIKPGITERELAFNLEFFIRKSGADALAFDLIVASGKNSAIPHAEPSDKVIEYGDFVTIDMGALYNGYHSDMTRTVAVGGISEHQRKVYNIVLEAQKRAINEIKPGIMCKDIDKAARNFIADNGYKKCFGHALGHGVGLAIHEKPLLFKRSEDILTPGMVITVEPGIYLTNEFGVRIEDMLLVTNNGYENLTNFDKNLIIL